MLACVSPENFEKNVTELKSLNIPFGFKLNGFVTTKIKDGYTSVFLNKNLAKSETTNKSAEIKNRIRAASVAQRSKPPKPYIPVITAIIKKGSVNRFIIECFCV